MAAKFEPPRPEAVLAAEYGLGQADLAGLAPDGAGWRVTVDGRQWRLKLGKSLNPANLDRVERMLGAAISGRSTPMVRPTNSGRLIGRDNDWAWLLQERLAADPAGTEAIDRAAAELARLHAGWRAIDPTGLVNHFQRSSPDLAATAQEHGLGWWAEGPARELALIEAERQSQVLHGDPHPGNLLDDGGRVWIIDFDSARSGPVSLDVGLAAFRLDGGRGEVFDRFVAGYNRYSTRPPVTGREARLQAVRQIIERICFLLNEQRAGRTDFWADLPNQRRFLEAARQGLAVTAQPSAGYDPQPLTTLGASG